MAGFWGFDCRLRDVEVDGPGMLPGPAVLFALGLYVITGQGGSIVGSCTRDVFICHWGKEQHFLAGLQLCQLSGTVCFVKAFLLGLLPGQ